MRPTRAWPGIPPEGAGAHVVDAVRDARPEEERRAPIKAGDVVVCHSVRILDNGTLELDVLDLAIAGRPEHPDRLHAAVLPRIGEIYGEAAIGR